LPARLEALYVYPIKSAAGIALDTAAIGPAGLAGDRRYMVVEPNGRFVTARQTPALLGARPRFDGEGLLVEAKGRPTLSLVPPSAAAPVVPVRVWRDTVPARRCGAEADAWFSALLGRPVHLVHLPDPAARPWRAGDALSFADAAPLLVTSTASLDELNGRLARPVGMMRFRPNLVVAGTDAWAEDRWRTLDVGGCRLDVAWPCTRCIVTTLDPETGAGREDGEPLATLGAFRRGDDGKVLFGVNAAATVAGVLSRGAAVSPD
jgi:hypothetical protein